jgi:hypothetical protein
VDARARRPTRFLFALSDDAAVECYSASELMKSSHILANWIGIIHRAVWRWPVMLLAAGFVELAVDPRHSLLHTSFLLGPGTGFALYDVVREFKEPKPSDLGFSSSKHAWYMYPVSAALGVFSALGDAYAAHRRPASLSLIVGLALLFALIAYLLRPRPAATT